MPQFPFNQAQHKPQSTLEQMPAGWYPARVIESDIAPTSKGDGFRLKLTFEIIDGPYKGRKVTSGYNIQNPNPQAVEIAMNEIAAICCCVGKFQPIQQSEELHGIPLQIKLTTQKDSDYNEVKGYRDINGNDPGKAGAGAPVAQTAPQSMPPQGFAQAPPPQYAQQPTNAYAPTQQPYPPQAPAPVAAPAWAPPAPQAAPQQAPAQAPAWAPQQPQQTAPQAQPQAPAWTPGAMPPAPPAWAGPQR